MRIAHWLATGLILYLGQLAFGEGLTFERFAGSSGGPGAMDGVGKVARFSSPFDVASGPDGAVYVADRANGCIRHIAPDGLVTTFAGACGRREHRDGAKHVARFESPVGLAVDRAGVVLVADGTSLRRISGNEVTTVVPVWSPATTSDATAATQFSSVVDVEIGSTGDVWLIDRNSVRKIGHDGVITTAAGDVAAEGDADGSGASARFRQPSRLATLPNGDIVVADKGNHRIRRVTTDGVVTTIAGGAAGSDDGVLAVARFRAPHAVAAGPNQDLYVADADGIRRIDMRSGTVTTLWRSRPVELYWSVTGVVVDSQSQLICADSGAHVISRLSTERVLTPWAGAAAETGYVEGTLDAARFAYPRGLAVDADGSVLVADASNQVIRRIRHGLTELVAGAPDAAGSTDGPRSIGRLYYPAGITLLPDGQLLIADLGLNVIRRMSHEGTLFTVAGTPWREGFANGTGRDALFDSPIDLAPGPGGAAYLLEQSRPMVRYLTSKGDVSTLSGDPWTDGTNDGPVWSARWDHPRGVAADAAGNLFVTDRRRIRKISDDRVSTLAGKTDAWGARDGDASRASFSDLWDVAVNPATQDLYVIDYGTVRRVTADGTVSTMTHLGSFAESELTFESELAIADDGQTFYATDRVGVLIGRPLINEWASVSPGKVLVGQEVRLGTQSTSNARLQWWLVSRPTGSRVPFPEASEGRPAFRPDVAGQYVFRLRAETPSGLRYSEVAVLVNEVKRTRAVRK